MPQECMCVFRLLYTFLHGPVTHFELESNPDLTYVSLSHVRVEPGITQVNKGD